MPTTRRRRVQGRREPLSDAVRHYLLTGEYATRGQFDTWLDAFMIAGQVMRCTAREGSPPDEWVEWGAQITAEHIAESPGSRPHGWWCFAAPGPRDCAGLPADLHVPAWLWRLHRGRPFQFCTIPVGTLLHLESEAHYLRRHQLLEPDERRRIALDAFEPEAIVGGDQSDITGATTNEEED